MASKRGQAEGSIYQLGTGKWQVAISVGFQKRKRRNFNTFREARRWLSEANVRKESGQGFDDSRITVGTFLTKWLTEVAANRVRHSTLLSYEQAINNHLIPAIGNVSLAKLTPQHVQSLLLKKHQEGISAEHIRRVLRAALSQAVKWEIVYRNVASLATPPKREKKAIQFLNESQARQFLQCVHGHKHEALYTIAIASGMRFGEALGLQWDDVNFESGAVTIRRQLRRNGRFGREFSEPKTKNARRTIQLPAFAIDSLKDHRLRQQIHDNAAAGDKWKESNLVFTSEIGTPCEERNVRRSLVKLLAENNLPPIRFHDLRHSCATLLLAQGVDARTIMQILGHSQITLTLDTYAHVLPSLTQDAADKMQRMMEKQS